MKKLLLSTLATFSCIFTIVQAQWSVGVSAGYTNNEFYTNISNYDYNYYKKKGGFVVSVPVKYAITKWFAVQGEPGYIQKSFSLVQELPTNPHTQLTSSYNYLQLPLMAHFSFGIKKWMGFVNIGGYGSYWLSGHIKGTELDGFNFPSYPAIVNTTQSVDGKYDFDSRRDRRLQWGLLAGIGLQYSFNKKLSLFAEGRYAADLTDQQKDYMRGQIPRYNITTSVTAGCFYHLPFNKHK